MMVGGGGGVAVTARDAGVFSIVGFAFLVLVGNGGRVGERGAVMKLESFSFLVSTGGWLKQDGLFW